MTSRSSRSRRPTGQPRRRARPCGRRTPCRPARALAATQGDHVVELGPGDYLRWDGSIPHDGEVIGKSRRGDPDHPDQAERLTALRAAYHRRVTRRAVTYASYLKVPELLALQVERSERADGPEHDELLFIVIHQVYELWFKQLLPRARRRPAGARSGRHATGRSTC